jgi:uncharacterized protein YbaR (Trm112 family)
MAGGVDSMEVKFEKAPERVLPRCPFCKHRLEKVWVKTKGMGFWQQKQILICPECESFLGYGSVRFFG